MKTRTKLAVFVGVLLATIAIVVSIIFTTQPAQSMGSSASVASAAQVKLPADLTGTWSTDKKATTKMTAKIVSGTIDVELASGDTTVTFWYGTFENPLTKETVISSTGMGIGTVGGKPYWSTEETKDFTMEGDKLTFQFSSAGASTKVVMARG